MSRHAYWTVFNWKIGHVFFDKVEAGALIGLKKNKFLNIT